MTYVLIETASGINGVYKLVSENEKKIKVSHLDRTFEQPASYVAARGKYEYCLGIYNSLKLSRKRMREEQQASYEAHQERKSEILSLVKKDC